MKVMISCINECPGYMTHATYDSDGGPDSFYVCRRCGWEVPAEWVEHMMKEGEKNTLRLVREDLSCAILQDRSSTHHEEMRVLYDRVANGAFDVDYSNHALKSILCEKHMNSPVLNSPFPEEEPCLMCLAKKQHEDQEKMLCVNCESNPCQCKGSVPFAGEFEGFPAVCGMCGSTINNHFEMAGHQDGSACRDEARRKATEEEEKQRREFAKNTSNIRFLDKSSLKEIENRAAEASGDWEWERDGDGILIGGIIHVPSEYDTWYEDAQMIIHARDDILSAVRTIKQLRDEIEILKMNPPRLTKIPTPAEEM